MKNKKAKKKNRTSGSVSSVQKSKQSVVCVTGGSRGIGAAIVQLFRDRGWFVATCGSSRASTATCRGDLNVVCDVRDADECTAFVEATMEKWGRLDVLINNAGLAGSNPLEAEASDAMWHEIIAVNLHGSYHMCKAALPHLPSDTGRIINIASVLGEHGVPDQSAYCAAKHGVIGLTRSLAMHLAPRRITVNAVCPGWVRTDMAYGRMRALGLKESSLNKSVPLGRFVEPEEVAALAFYLSSSAAAMLTGQALTIDGGSFV